MIVDFGLGEGWEISGDESLAHELAISRDGDGEFDAIGEAGEDLA